MRSCIDIGIDTQGTACPLPHFGSNFREFLALFLAFEIELADPGLERGAQFRSRLAHPGEHDLARFHPGGQRSAKLADRYDICAISLICQDFQDRKVGVGLDRESQQRIAMSHSGQSIAEDRGMTFQRCFRIDIDRRPDLIGDARHRYIFAVQVPVF